MAQNVDWEQNRTPDGKEGTVFEAEEKPPRAGRAHRFPLKH